MIARQPRPRLPNGVGVKKRILTEGLELIWLLRRQPANWQDVEMIMGLPRREFYRYIEALKLAKAPINKTRDTRGRIAYRLPTSWP